MKHPFVQCFFSSHIAEFWTSSCLWLKRRCFLRCFEQRGFAHEKSQACNSSENNHVYTWQLSIWQVQFCMLAPSRLSHMYIYKKYTVNVIHVFTSMYIYICIYLWYQDVPSSISVWMLPALRLQKEERGRGSEEASKKAQEAMDAAKKRLIQKRKQELLASKIIKNSDH